MKKAVWFTFLAAIAISCLNNPDCFRLNNGEFGINFRVMGFGADNSVVDSATIVGTNIYVKSEIPSSIGLPLDPLLDSLKYNFYWEGDSSDVLSLGYTSQIQFVSADCGERHVFGGLTVLNYSFDSISVYSTTPTNPSSVNIQVFRCARPNLFGLSFKQRVTSTTTKDSTVIIKSITPNFGDPIIFQGADTSRKAVYIPLNKEIDSAEYVFDFGAAGTRMLVLKYDTQEKLWAVKSCGTTTLFASIKVSPRTTLVAETKDYKFLKQTTSDPAILNLEVIPK
ncbi:hypothetical protein SAMN04488109_2792 [Chryseolinea serpens]|uniref:Uncharacterized protein n=1 Tax=Chryseolinea serpens TaxID=947013 RepID=A0A1M5PBY4_9BACT|nr:hypothetical protein [Chryseolinea serpens]SHG99207.1 hypothetical protein SAMN04488109_2792 [Chryseolinea serpens]